MKTIVKNVGNNQTEIHYTHKDGDNVILFVSYQTPVAVKLISKTGNITIAKTIDKYSITTTKHINKFLYRHEGQKYINALTGIKDYVQTNESELREMLAESGVNM